VGRGTKVGGVGWSADRGARFYGFWSIKSAVQCSAVHSAAGENAVQSCWQMEGKLRSGPCSGLSIGVERVISRPIHTESSSRL